MATVGRGAEQYTVRFPDGLRDRIKVAADNSNRSMNAEIVARLEASFNFDGVTDDLVTDLNKRVDKLTDMINNLAKNFPRGD